jgi:hypothetical protein
VCAIAHTSGTFATDYAAGKWQIFTNPTIASAIAFTPTTTLSSTNVQSAIEEADTNARTDSALLLSNFYGGF